MDEDILNPIQDCSYHNEGDGLCNHDSNITPECHTACCPRLSKELTDLIYPKPEKVELNMGDMCVTSADVIYNTGAGKDWGRKPK